MSEHEWVDVPELSEQYVYTLDMPLEQHNTEMFNAGREAVESKLVATQRKLMTTESQLRELADVGIQSAQRTNAELERVTEKVAEQEQMIADLQAIIAENRGLNEKLDAQRREAVNSLRAAAASERNAWKDLEAKSAECQQLLAAKASADKGWDAFEAKKSEWHKLYEEKERISHACNELREQLRCARRDHEATKSHHTSLIEDRAHVGKELVKVRGELEVEKEAVGVFQAQLAQAEKQLASLPKQPQTIANELDRLRKELQAETERKESLQRCVASRNEQIDRLKREHEATKAHQLAMIAEDQKRLVHELTTAREELQGVREKLATRGRELTAQIHVSQLMAREKELFRKEAGEMRTRMESAEQQLRDTDNREGVVEEEFRRLESEQKRELAEALNANADLKNTVTAMMFAHTVLSKELQAKENEVAALQETVNALDKTVIEELKAELVALNERFGAERSKRFEAEQDVLRLRATLQEMSAEQDYTTKQLRALAASEHTAKQELRKERGIPFLTDRSFNPQLLSAAQQHAAAAAAAINVNGKAHAVPPFRAHPEKEEEGGGAASNAMRPNLMKGAIEDAARKQQQRIAEALEGSGSMPGPLSPDLSIRPSSDQPPVEVD